MTVWKCFPPASSVDSTQQFMAKFDIYRFFKGKCHFVIYVKIASTEKVEYNMVNKNPSILQLIFQLRAEVTNVKMNKERNV